MDLKTEPMRDGTARTRLQEELRRFHCRVHQPGDPPLFSASPEPGMRSHHWRWRDLAPLLERLGDEIGLQAGGPRRTLRLASPGLESGTTPTFWASIQVILPGEVATAHRHTASAFRFILQGSGAATTVDGERYAMHEGDLVLTPAWAWHDHEHAGTAPMIWLDVLDISLMRALQATFFQPYASDTQAVGAVHDLSFRQYGSGLMRPLPDAQPPARAGNPMLVYPHVMAQAALVQASGAPPDPFDDTILEYQDPTTGGSAMPTMAMTLQRLRAGMKGRSRRSTGSRLFYVLQGEGTSLVDGERFEWETGDFFTVAPWNWYEHANTGGGGHAVLFQVSDVPTLKALGFYRQEQR